MTFRYVLAEGHRAKAKLEWYLSHGWQIVGMRTLGGCENYLLKKGEL